MSRDRYLTVLMFPLRCFAVVYLSSLVRTPQLGSFEVLCTVLEVSDLSLMSESGFARLHWDSAVLWLPFGYILKGTGSWCSLHG